MLSFSFSFSQILVSLHLAFGTGGNGLCRDFPRLPPLLSCRRTSPTTLRVANADACLPVSLHLRPLGVGLLLVWKEDANVTHCGWLWPMARGFDVCPPCLPSYGTNAPSLGAERDGHCRDNRHLPPLFFCGFVLLLIFPKDCFPIGSC